MQIEGKGIFPIPFFRTVYNNSINLKNSVMPVFYDIEKNDVEPVSYSLNGYTNYNTTTQILDLNELVDLKNFIVSSVQTAHESLGFQEKLKFSNSWFAINRKFSYHEKHNHLPDLWSGVYYVSAGLDDPGLTLCNPNFSSNWPFMSVLYPNEYTSAEITCQAETGVLYIFPSYLEHKVNQQKNDTDRVMIAFNMVVA
jgi:uncharacterized protein (TIGR02466 family)